MRTNETGHYKNVASLNALKVFAESLGGAFAPQKEILQLQNLQNLVNEVNALHNAVREQINTTALSVDQRQLVFQNVKPLSTRVINTMSSTNVNEATIKDAKFFNAKIQGSRIKKKTAETDPEKERNTNSVSRQSYDSIYENFSNLNDLLIQDGNYNPTETDINNAALTTKQDEMLAANQNIAMKLTELANKRIMRNNRFYVDGNCLINVGRGIKQYIRGKYGVQSPEFAVIKNLLFRDLKIK